MRVDKPANTPALLTLGTRTGQRLSVKPDGTGFCSVCGEPGERFTPAQPNFLCRKHWLQGMPDPIEFERMLTARS